ncbi:MAG: hypothetical protein HZA95_00390 [Candidatus Vogelbacteria bacterium]|nr:hypothetical protein [Candidatus Vogelbacteria bacterium]
MIKVRLVRLGKPIQSLPLTDGATVDDMILASEQNLTPDMLRLNKEPVQGTWKLKDGDTYYVEHNITGGR